MSIRAWRSFRPGFDWPLGNGDVQIGLASLEKLPYVMGLVRQSFDRKWAMEEMREQLQFLQSEWPQLFADGQKAEALVIPDPRTACFYARRTLELAVE